MENDLAWNWGKKILRGEPVSEVTYLFWPLVEGWTDTVDILVELTAALNLESHEEMKPSEAGLGW